LRNLCVLLSPHEEIQDDGEENAYHDRRHDGDEDGGIPTLDEDVSWQPAEAIEPRDLWRDDQQETDRRQRQTRRDEKAADCGQVSHGNRYSVI
jgi:hypothetical protein